MRSASVRNPWQAVRTMVQTSARLLALLSLLQIRREWTGQELADRLEVGSAHDPPRRRQAALARLSGRGRPGGRRGLPPRCRRRAAAAAARRRRGRRRGARPAHRRLRGRSPGSRRRRSARSPSSSRSCPAACGAGSSALSDATSAFGVDGPRIDADVVATLAGACRDGVRLHFAYVAKDDRPRPAQHRAVRRRLQRLALVPGRVRPRPRRLADVPHRPDPRTGPSRGSAAGDGPSPAEIRPPTSRRSCGTAVMTAARPPPGQNPACSYRPRRPAVGSRRATRRSSPTARMPASSAPADRWSRSFLVWMALLDEPIEVLDPPELAEAARTLVARLGAAG